ncbi:ketopantoate reductase family protein [Teichococcus wenyumeiae]|nr:ketopantoate reductase C-terminal domain-containing protein [Pseudoroseomonas wenyumeiae]
MLFIGAGAVGGFMAAHLARSGADVVMWEPWATNREAITRDGLTIADPDETFTVPLRTIASAADIPSVAPSVMVLCTKMADAPAIVADVEAAYRGTWIVTLNALADLDMAEALGADRVMGCIVTGLFGNLVRPGSIRRHRERLRGGAPTFRIGETAGAATPRIHALVQAFGLIDGAEAVPDMAAARWGKMVFNCMTSPLSALHQRPIRDFFVDPAQRPTLMKAGIEVTAVAAAYGITIDPVCGVSGAIWHAAAAGDVAAQSTLEAGLIRYGEAMNATSLGGMAQDVERGRRTEVSLINGVVVNKGLLKGVAAPTNAWLVESLDALTAGTAQ